VKSALAWLAVAGMLIAIFVHYGYSIPQVKQLAGAQPPQAADSDAAPPAVSPLNQKMVTMAGPLAEWMQDGNAAAPVSTERRVGKPHPNDHIAPSPVGSSSAVVHKTFALSNAINFPFQIPPHAVNAQLRGSYRSFVAEQSVQASDETADVAFLLMNEEQYATFIRGGSPDTLLNLDPSHDQDVNFGLPASRDLPVKYYIVFRNDPREGRKIVQADFKVDF
jgi:hypothetical protein